MNHTFKYVITEFNNPLKYIKVEFEDKSWAQIALNKPLPKDEEELHAIVSSYAAPIEHEEAIDDEEADLEFIRKAMGKQMEGDRRRLFPPEEPVFVDSELDDMIAREIGREATENQNKSKRTLERAYQVYSANLALAAGPLRTKLTKESLAAFDEFEKELTDIITTANQAIKDDVAYEVVIPAFDMEFTK